MKLLCALLVAAALWLGYRHWTRPLVHPPGVLVEAPPQQRELPSNAEVIEHGAFRLKPLAHFAIEGRVLHRKTYGYDRNAALSPVDLALGWGRMSDQAVLDRLSISQSMRFYWYRYQTPPPVPQDEIVRSSTNVHIIPADAATKKICKSLRAGELVRMQGRLVEATGPEIGKWRSSLRRDDTGNGACELLYVERVAKVTADDLRLVPRLVSR